ncbi:hypothetical protein NDU88_003482 [Pleurodeles waltl]|uniref:Uncharacterized protein n=1 Tax=Pleurodeles waltl TaxID=8319 RepID=A0AAV7V061_PLEWA|nr:hypothetical protein NDU88_003482 [Pleurodeles waltl]
MGRHRGTEASWGNTMEQYTTPVAPLQRQARSEVSGDVADAPSSAGEPSRKELLAAIQGSRVALEGKIETFALEVNLLRADLRKVSNKVKAAEGSIAELQSEVGTLRTQMAQATSTVGRLEARLEDAERRSFPESQTAYSVYKIPGQPSVSLLKDTVSPSVLAWRRSLMVWTKVEGAALWREDAMGLRTYPLSASWDEILTQLQGEDQVIIAGDPMPPNELAPA